MSAIAGACYTDGRTMERELLDRIARTSARRGFDGIRCWNDGPVGLIRFAHATTPEAVGETQPFVAPSGNVMVFDGRLDNREQALTLLGDAGARSDPDGTLALALFERFGDDFVHRLVGDYAIAVWQPARRRLLLVRSPLGFRPLLWAFDGRTFGFATEPRGLVLGLGMERRLNEGALAEYLSGRFVSDTDTFWHGIRRVVQGGAVAIENGNVREWGWHGGPFEDWTDRSLDDHVEEFRRLFDQALVSTTRSSTAVTSQLSGGLDSSTVVCRAAELFRAGKLDRPVGAISARFPGEPHDETEWSSAVEAHTGIEAEVTRSQRFDADVARQWCAESYQLPMRPNVLDTMVGACYRLAGDGRRVLLTGEGGDDWLNGYFAHWPDLFLRLRWRSLLRHGAEQWPDSPRHVQLRRTVLPTFMPFLSPNYRNTLFRPHLDNRLPATDWLRPEWIAKTQLVDRWQVTESRPALKGFSQRARYTTVALPKRHVAYDHVFAFTESQGIELRHPFHDQRLVRFFMGASGNYLRRHNERKVLLREATRGTLPEKVRTRTTKAAFITNTVAAIDELFRQRPPQDMLCVKLGWIDGDRIERMHAPFRAWAKDGGTGPLPDTSSGPVWFALATDMWLEHSFGL